MGSDAKISYDEAQEEWIAQSGKVITQHRTPTTALRRLKAQTDVDIEDDQWFEKASFPGTIKKDILRLRDTIEKLEAELDRCRAERGALARMLEKRYGLRRTEIASAFRLTSSYLGAVMDGTVGAHRKKR